MTGKQFFIEFWQWDRHLRFTEHSFCFRNAVWGRMAAFVSSQIHLFVCNNLFKKNSFYAISCVDEVGEHSRQTTDRPLLDCPVSDAVVLCPVWTTSKSFISRSGLATVMVRSGTAWCMRRISVQ